MAGNQHILDAQDSTIHFDSDEDESMPKSVLSMGKSVRGKRGRPQKSAQESSMSMITPEGNNTASLTHPLPIVDRSGPSKRGRQPNHVTNSLDNHSQISMEGRYHLRSNPTIPVSNSCLAVADGMTKQKQPWKLDSDDLHMPLFQSSDHPRDTIEDVLMTFGALKRRIMQLKDVKGASKQHIFKALRFMEKAGYHVNRDKRVGEVPGVEIGDMFYFKMEMLLVGLHSNINGGIESMSFAFAGKEEKIATCIVSSGLYENDDDDPYTLIYNGQGKVHQKLQGGNYSLNQSLIRKNHIRVIRTEPNPLAGLDSKEKIYIYDGLYKIETKYRQIRKSHSNLKFKLVREPGQADGIVVWKNTKKWRENPSSRDHIVMTDMSNGAESTCVCVVNEIDNEDAPRNFTYSIKLDIGSHLVSVGTMHRCECTSSCPRGEDGCSCSKKNGSYLPYTTTGILVCRMPVIYECSNLCACNTYCPNRVVQRGCHLHFEIFKTTTRGWGLRSWDPIPAGAFICEYAGVLIDRHGLIEEDEYIFEVTGFEHNLKWNYIPELLGEPSLCDMNNTFKKLPMVISAKHKGNVSRFMNHSCSPNIFYQPVMYDHGDEGYPHIAFFAIKNIPPMTELTYDYGQSNGSGCRTPKICICQSHSCKGTFG